MMGLKEFCLFKDGLFNLYYPIFHSFNHSIIPKILIFDIPEPAPVTNISRTEMLSRK